MEIQRSVKYSICSQKVHPCYPPSSWLGKETVPSSKTKALNAALSPTFSLNSASSLSSIPSYPVFLPPGEKRPWFSQLKERKKPFFTVISARHHPLLRSLLSQAPWKNNCLPQPSVVQFPPRHPLKHLQSQWPLTKGVLPYFLSLLTIFFPVAAGRPPPALAPLKVLHSFLSLPSLHVSPQASLHITATPTCPSAPARPADLHLQCGYFMCIRLWLTTD